MVAAPIPAADGLNVEPDTPAPLKAPPAGDPLNVIDASDTQTTVGIEPKVITGYVLTVRVAALDVTDPQPAVTITRYW